MAKTAAMTASSSSPKAEQQVMLTCTVTNNDGSAINVTSIQPTVAPTGGTRQDVAAVLGMPPLGGAFPTSVAASGGTLAVQWPAVFHAPVSSVNQWAEQDNLQYDCGAVVYLSDGTSISASATTITVGHPSN